MAKWSFKNIGELFTEVKEKAEEYAIIRRRLGNFWAFMSYGLGTILLLKISQVVLGWGF